MVFFIKSFFIYGKCNSIAYARFFLPCQIFCQSLFYGKVQQIVETEINAGMFYRRATCMRIRPNAGQFLAGVLQSVTRCVITSVSDVVNSIEEHDVKTAFRANQELRFLTKDCLINIVVMSSDEEI